MRRVSIARVLCFLCSLCLVVSVAGADVATTELTDMDDAGGDNFGTAVAISGDTAVVGAPLGDGAATDSGSAYIYQWDGSTWQQAAKLTASDGVASDEFGYSVDISGDTVIVGARHDDDGGGDSGSAYLFEKPLGGWATSTETTKFTASDAAASDFFGHAVAISGDSVVVGAWFDDATTVNSGSAYVFEKTSGTWGQSAKLTASDAAMGDSFGYSVGISDDTVIVGAHAAGTESGAAYLFEKPSGGTWGQTAKLTASDAAVGDRFGFSVDVWGDAAVVGMYLDNDGAMINSGSAYLFEKPSSGTWTEAAKLTASDAAADDEFGYSVGIWDDTVVVGAHFDADNGTGTGSAYRFEEPVGGWGTMTETTKLLAFDGVASDNFGQSVGISGGNTIIGAPYHDHSTNPSSDGAAYVHAVPVPGAALLGMVGLGTVAWIRKRRMA